MYLLCVDTVLIEECVVIVDIDLFNDAKRGRQLVVGLVRQPGRVATRMAGSLKLFASIDVMTIKLLLEGNGPVIENIRPQRILGERVYYMFTVRRYEIITHGRGP
jgi:hypothetical protein